MTGAPNCQNPPWSDPLEKDIVDEAWSALQAWADYVAMFPAGRRTREAVRRRWNRVHAKVPA